MKRFALFCISALIVVAVAGCFYQFSTPTVATGPYDGDVGTTKIGTSKCQEVFFLIIWGDCSVKKAMEDGGITKIHHVDHHIEEYVGVYGVFTTTVYGR